MEQVHELWQSQQAGPWMRKGFTTVGCMCTMFYPWSPAHMHRHTSLPEAPPDFAPLLLGSSSSLAMLLSQHQAAEQAIFLTQELIVRALLHYLALVNHYNLVHITDS